MDEGNSQAFMPLASTPQVASMTPPVAVQTGDGVYSNTQIKAAIKSGHIVFHPYIEEHIAGSSVDVTLGHWYYRTERNTNGGFYNPFDEGDVQKYFDGPHSAETHQMWAEANGRKLFAGIPADQPIIVLAPGERILAHTDRKSTRLNSSH